MHATPRTRYMRHFACRISRLYVFFKSRSAYFACRVTSVWHPVESRQIFCGWSDCLNALSLAVVPAEARSDTSGGGMRRAWTGRRVCDDTYRRCHRGVSISKKGVGRKKNKKKTKKKKIYTVPHSTTFVLCYTVFFVMLSLCASCVKN